MPELIAAYDLPGTATSYLTSSVQLGFIIGTLVFALLCLVDRHSPSRVFLGCAVLGAAFNICMIYGGNTYTSLLAWRFLTGLCLAGIYPVGMKIAADYYSSGLGRSLGYLVGALVLGTALPHLLRDIQGQLSWDFVIITTSTLALLGGIAMAILVPDGPHCTTTAGIDLRAIVRIFKVPRFRAAATGYFGHMWELYTFWACVPLLLRLYGNYHPTASLNTPLLSFIVIAVGSVGCIIAGYLAEVIDSRQVAGLALAASGICCLLLPLSIVLAGPSLFIVFLIFWGMVVVADSPLLSTLVAHNAPPALKGTALTIVTSIGFMLTIISIQVVAAVYDRYESPCVFMILAVGPVLGLLGLYRKSGSAAVG
jgi:MFS family permease